MTNHLREVMLSVFLLISVVSQSGCLLLAAGAGAEAGYVATQDRPVGQTLTDQRITTSIKSQFLVDAKVSALNINVDTLDGEVTLRGFVADPSEEHRAVQIAQDVTGVKSVTSKLTVQ